MLLGAAAILAIVFQQGHRIKHTSRLVLIMVATWTGKPEKIGKHFPVREKSGIFNPQILEK